MAIGNPPFAEGILKHNDGSESLGEIIAGRIATALIRAAENVEMAARKPAGAIKKGINRVRETNKRLQS